MHNSLRLPLKEFLESFHTPQVGRLLSGIPDGLLDGTDIDIGPGTVLKFHRKVSPNVPVTFKDPWSGRDDHWIKVTLPIDFPATFKLLAYDPVSEDSSTDHIYNTVADLLGAFPVYVKANVDYSSSEETHESFVAGDILKLIRVVYRNESKVLECRHVHQSRLLHLPMSCRGNFTLVVTDNEYLLSDLVSLVPRKRRVAIKLDAKEKPAKIPGLPSDYQGDLFINEPEYFVEASPLNEPGTIIGLPHNLDMMVSPDEVALEKGMLLNSFATNSRNLFPVVVTVSDWDEETTILENHYIKPGVELVIHGWTRQSKLLAHSERKENLYAIPLTYLGKFHMKQQEFRSVAELENAHPAYKLRVVDVDLTETDCLLSKDDIIRIKRSESMKRPKAGDMKYLKVEKLHSRGTTRWKEIKLPMSAKITFEEMMQDTPANDFNIKDLVTFVTEQPVKVELTQRSPDQKIPDRDLPKNEVITLNDFVVEPAVYVSVGAVDAPAFHIPLRTLLYVDFVEQLDRSSSPLLTKQSPKLSTLDRCVERLTSSTFQQLIATKHTTSTPFPNFQKAKVYGGPNAWSSSVKVETRSSLNEDTQSVRISPKIREEKPIGQRKYHSTENVFKASQLEPPRQSPVRADRPDRITVDVHSEAGVTRAYSFGKRDHMPQKRGYVRRNSETSSVARAYSFGASRASQVLGPGQEFELDSSSVKEVRGASLPRQQLSPGSGSEVRGSVYASSQSSYSNAASLPPSGFQTPPGFVLMPTAQAQAIPAGFSLVPVVSPFQHGSVSYAGSTRGPPSTIADDEDYEFDDNHSDISKFTIRRSNSFKVIIPNDGNLYHFSCKKFIELLKLLKIDESAIRTCMKEKIDGKKFSRMYEGDLEEYGILHPIIVHFRRNTSRRKAASNFAL